MSLSIAEMMTHFSTVLVAFLLLHLISLPPHGVQATPEDEAVGKWAIQFGDELWELAQRITKSQEIKAKYKEYNARVELKNCTTLIKSITASVGRMLSRKMDAVRCILQKAEKAYEEFEFNRTYAEKEFRYYSSKFSRFDGKRSEELLKSLNKFDWMYLNMTLNPDTHFYNNSVDTSHSSVHVPSNVYDRSPSVLKAIMWSEELDEVFRQNFQSDPALSWQYFGSDTGILRHYPASQWEPHSANGDADTYDCRKRSWYIETATCSKDIVILLDNSGSMTGFRNHVAKFTIRSILDTFSNNDFFNIFNYSATVDDIIPCFKDALVQATPENIKVFNDAIEELLPEGYANLTVAYEKAFQLLRKYYIERRCNETSTCNQAIMLVTDGVAGNTTEIFEKYNWASSENDTSKMRVRIFTYLLGKEVTKVREIQWMACLNRGYYSHVQTLDEVHEEVLKYVDVIATPLVLQDVDHPPTWTHSFTDKTYKPVGNDSNTRLMIAVGVPAFDRSYRNENSTKRARLLGVAGTDVPVEDIDKLALPYKLGVNGYAFVVSNNGYVLLHPDLRPIARNGRMNPNYNSIDFTEVEQLYDDNMPRQPGEDILKLRSGLVHGNMSDKSIDISVKFHYDKMRRVSRKNQNYYYAPLPNTPFTLGIVLPSDYGDKWIKVGEEVSRNIHMKVNISDFFVGDNWKVHPDWVYCKYHYLEGHEFKTPEEELRHFLKKMVQKDWKWSEQYEDDGSSEEENLNCGRKTLNDDAYYCNKELVHLLIFDAKVTNSSYGEWKFSSREERILLESFDATLRFVSTMSGLTRWQFIDDKIDEDMDREFGDYYKTAIDETWYKSAILEYSNDTPDNFVYAVKHADDPMEEDNKLRVTASHAIFPRDGGNNAPACVVGFQFSHDLMVKRFFNITSRESCNGCINTCDSDGFECYVIDNNAYILISQNVNHTGKFFGEYQGDVMSAMVEKGIFLNIDVYDYQAMCRESPESSSDARSLLHPVRLLILGLKWLMAELVLYWTHIQWWVDGAPFLEYIDEINDDYDSPHAVFPGQASKPIVSEEGELIFQEKEPEPEYSICDTRSSLYVLEQKSLEGINDYIKVPTSRPFYVKKIPYSNLLLVVVNVLTPSSGNNAKLTTSPQVIEYDLEFPCYKLNMSFYERRRIEECFTEHPEEEEYTYCGDATTLRLQVIPIFTITTLIFLATHYLHH